MAGEQDQALSNELAHLIKATAAPETVVAAAEFLSAIALARSQSETAKAELDRSVKAVDDDGTENKAVALAFANALTACLDELRFVGGNVKNRLLNLRAEDRQALGAEEMSNRERFIATNIEPAPSEIASMGRTAAVNRVRSIHDRLAENTSYAPAAEIAAFAASVKAVEEAHARVLAEKLDDQPLYDSLVKARVEAQSFRVAFRSLLDGVLRFERSPVDVDQFLIRTGSPVPVEPVTPETPATPEAPVTPVEPPTNG